MQTLTLRRGSCADQQVDAVVNAANGHLLEGGGVCGAIFERAGGALAAACARFPTPLADGSAVTTPAFQMKNAKVIIHAVGPDFGRTPRAFALLRRAYYQSLLQLKANGLHTIAFPLISAGIYGGHLADPAGVSARQCCWAFRQFVAAYPNYPLEVTLCAYSAGDERAARAALCQDMCTVCGT